MSRGWFGPGHHQIVQGGNQQGHIMDVGRAGDDRERDATPVGEQAALASFFSPDPSGWARHILAPGALCPWPRQCFANPKRSLPSRHIPPVRLAKAPEKSPLCANSGNAYEWRWPPPIPWAAPSTDSRCARRKRWPQRFAAEASVFSRRPVCVDRADRQAAFEAEEKVQRRPKTHPIFPKISFVASWELIFTQIASGRQVLFTDKLLE